MQTEERLRWGPMPCFDPIPTVAAAAAVVVVVFGLLPLFLLLLGPWANPDENAAGP